MSELVERVVRRFVSEAKEYVDKKVQEALETKEWVDKRTEEIKQELLEISKIALPVNILEVLAKGGFVKSWEHEVKKGRSPEYLAVSIDGYPLEMPLYGGREIKLTEGKYRITLIVEKLD